MENRPVPVNNSQSKPDHDESDTWILEVVTGPHASNKFTMDELLKEPKLNKKTLSVTMIHPGFDAGGKQRASQETSTWLGFPLSEVLHLCGINNTDTPKKCLNLLFTGVGHDESTSCDQFKQTSLKVEVATDPAREIILAYKKNGKELSSGKGGNPLRLILPGFVSGGMLKGLNKIQVQTRSTQVEECLELKINSVITDPDNGKKLDKSSLPAFKGYAYSGGGREVTQVQLSLDGGGTWRECQLDPLEVEALSEHDKFWCCHKWSLEEVGGALLSPDVKEIVVRAVEKSGETQLANGRIPNIEGMNNCWYKVKIKHLEGENGIIFEHPTDPRANPVANDQPEEPSSQSAHDQVYSET